VFEKYLAVARDGGTRELPIEEALQQRTLQDALAGKRMAIREDVKWITERETWLAEQAPKPRRKRVEMLSAPDPDNADAAVVLLGIAAPDQDRAWFSGPTQLLLEPWAVQAALRRRRGGQRLTDEERDEIERCTRDLARWERQMTSWDDTSDDTEDNGVGYGRPPKTSRFTKDRSGNPAGRPRGRHQQAPYEAVLGQLVTIREGGTERRVSATEAFCSSLQNPDLKATAPPPGHR
jgi:Family of unknown function (DUF5681)